MHKACRELKTTLAKADLVIEILDARIPFSSENPLLTQLRNDKPCLKLLNKSDLADPEVTACWLAYFNQEKQTTAYPVTKEQPKKIKEIIESAKKLVRTENRPEKTIKALVAGIPNVGKSTIINILAGKVIAKTGNEPAITKQQQNILLSNNLTLIDTPGVLWPNLENQKSAYRLAATGAVKDTALVHEDVAQFLAEYLLGAYPNQLTSRFGFSTSISRSSQLIDEIGKKRGCLIKGGVVDKDKAAKIILTEFRAGKFGNITLETPQMREQELIEVENLRQQKAADQFARKERRPNEDHRALREREQR